jgi:GDP/UDP-N,N'-diacetylbacillosamine 2-epimerase (hydrolysing)
MGGSIMKIGLLTSTRADWGILYPLAKEINNDVIFDLEVIAFGTHLSREYGYTIDEIKNQGFAVPHSIQSLPQSDTAKDISDAIGSTIKLFALFWAQNKYDLVICLGDRYEMFAAVSAASPFIIPIAHIHAGETTLGAIDNAYRHAISLMSKYLFVSTETYRTRAIEINQCPQLVFNVGGLSVDNMKHQTYFTKEAFKDTFAIDLNKPTILTTFHPETVALDKNNIYITQLLEAIKELKNKYQVVITMPNSDTMGLIIRKEIEAFGKQHPEIKLIESFGMKGYLTCMKYCFCLLGNTSSGFGEAAYYPKWVINLGDRQKGRLLTKNIVNCSITKTAILDAVKHIETTLIPQDCNIYGNGDTAKQIVAVIKNILPNE